VLHRCADEYQLACPVERLDENWEFIGAENEGHEYLYAGGGLSEVSCDFPRFQVLSAIAAQNTPIAIPTISASPLGIVQAGRGPGQ
jgi:hypothetical protein